MCKEKDTNGAGNGAQKRKNPVGVPFTAMNAKQAQEASVRARNLRKQVRAEMLNKIVSNYDFGDEMLKAMKKCDMDKVELLREAMKLIGLTHDQSEEAVTKMHIDATTDNKTELIGQVDFVVKK